MQQRTWLFIAGRAFEQSSPCPVTENNNSSHKADNHFALLRVLCAAKDETSVLCAAKDETSVEIMGRVFCCNFLRKSRL
jgi:hypothetical protein